MVDHSDIIKQLSEAQEAETDIREMCREQELALYARGGQWEASVWSRLANRPRYTIDLMSPIRDQICGEMGRSRFDISVLPKSHDANKKTADTYNGMIRHIEQVSQADMVYYNAGKKMVECGISGWRIDLGYANDYNFDQDLTVKFIPNFKDRVWFDPASEMQDRSDAEWCVVLTPQAKRIYEKKYPKGSGQSVSQDSLSNYYYFKANTVITGEFIRKKKKKKKILLMSNGMALEDGEDTRSIIDELQAYGITVLAERNATIDAVCIRRFDGGDWLEEEKETIFRHIPVVPTYGNFTIIEDKPVYFGLPEKLLDPQRITNYTLSRLTEDTSLRPKSKVWMTPEQARGHVQSYRTLNIDHKPVALYNHVEGQPEPGYKQPAPPDPALVTITDATTQYINKISGLFASNMGENPGLQSGVAIENQINQGNNGMYGYFLSQRIAVTHTARILVESIPEVYGEREQVRILGKDAKADYVNLSETVVDRQTGQEVKLVDLSKGFFDVVCDIGPAFQNKQQEAVDNIIEIAKVDPSILQLGSDVLLNNINAPGIKQIAERKRRQMAMAGVIPGDQLTEEEKAMLQQAQGQQQASPQDQAAMALAQAEQKKAEAQAADIMSKAQDRMQKNEIEMKKLALKADELVVKGQEQQQKLSIEMQRRMDEHYKMVADTLKTIKEAMGAETVVNSATAQAYDQQARRLTPEGNAGLLTAEGGQSV